GPSATTIHPLSLHDALPIWLGTAAAGPHRPEPAGEGLGFLIPFAGERVNLLAVVDGDLGDDMGGGAEAVNAQALRLPPTGQAPGDRKSTRLNSSHVKISYAV